MVVSEGEVLAVVAVTLEAAEATLEAVERQVTGNEE